MGNDIYRLFLQDVRKSFKSKHSKRFQNKAKSFVLKLNSNIAGKDL